VYDRDRPHTARPTGVDVAAAMVERARLRCPGLDFVEGDAQQLPFPDAAFDAVTMNFGILHLSQPQTALAEARRVLIPGGRFAFTSWMAEGNAEAEITDAAVAEHGVPAEVPQGPAYYVCAEPSESRAALSGAGFDVDTLRTDTVTVLWRVPTPEHLSRHSCTRVSAPPRSSAPSRPSGWQPFARPWSRVSAATRMARNSRCQSPRA
jgi:SAM-dependent methyltransferase